MEEPTKAPPPGKVDTTGWTVLEGAPNPVSKPPVLAPSRLSTPALISTKRPEWSRPFLFGMAVFALAVVTFIWVNAMPKSGPVVQAPAPARAPVEAIPCPSSPLVDSAKAAVRQKVISQGSSIIRFHGAIMSAPNSPTCFVWGAVDVKDPYGSAWTAAFNVDFGPREQGWPVIDVMVR